MSGSRVFALKWWLPVVAAVILALPSNVLSADELRRETCREFPLAAAGRVKLENVIGSVNIKTWASDKVRVRAIKTLDLEYLKDMKDCSAEKAINRIEIGYEADSNEVRITTVIHDMELSTGPSGVISACKSFFSLFKGDCSRLPLKVEYELSVPERCDVNVRCDIGEIVVEGVQGNLELESEIGRVATLNTRGRLYSRLSIGHISIEGASGGVDAKSDMGQVQAELDSLGADDCVRLESGMGKVSLLLPSGAGVDLDAESDLGGVDSDFGDNSFKGRCEWNSLRGRLNNGGASVSLKTGMGGIEIANK